MNSRIAHLLLLCILGATSLLTGCVVSEERLMGKYFKSPYSKITLLDREENGSVHYQDFRINPSNKNTYINDASDYVGDYLGLVDVKDLGLAPHYAKYGVDEYIAAQCIHKKKSCAYMEINFDIELGIAVYRSIQIDKITAYLANEKCQKNDTKEMCFDKIKGSIAGVTLLNDTSINITSTDGMKNLILFARKHADSYKIDDVQGLKVK